MTSRPLMVRDSDEAMIGGVMAGLARRLGWDVSMVRIGFVILSVASAAFPGTLVYLLLWAIVPDELGRRSPAPWVLTFLIFVLPVVLALCGMLTAMGASILG